MDEVSGRRSMVSTGGASIRVGTAGWSIARDAASSFPGSGRHLSRYSRVLRCAEINTSFKGQHRRSVYERWADETSDGFEFCVKTPKSITHDARLTDVGKPLDEFLSQASGLGEKLAAVLVQLPPSLAYDAKTVREFFTRLGGTFHGAIVCEPRHATWFTEQADHALTALGVSRAAVDPATHASAGQPGGWLGTEPGARPALRYYRWHGSPRVYWSNYSTEWINQKATTLTAARGRDNAWCIFDNTAAGAAIHNALQLNELLDDGT